MVVVAVVVAVLVTDVNTVSENQNTCRSVPLASA